MLEIHVQNKYCGKYKFWRVFTFILELDFPEYMFYMFSFYYFVSSCDIVCISKVTHGLLELPMMNKAYFC